MNRNLAAGLVLSAVGLAGYVTGIWTAYPGRSLSVTALMAGLTFAAIGRSLDPATGTDGEAGTGGSR